MEALVLLLIVLGFGFFSFPLYSYFIAVGLYSVIFFEVGTLFWVIFALLAFVFLSPILAKIFFPSQIVHKALWFTYFTIAINASFG